MYCILCTTTLLFKTLTFVFSLMSFNSQDTYLCLIICNHEMSKKANSYIKTDNKVVLYSIVHRVIKLYFIVLYRTIILRQLFSSRDLPLFNHLWVLIHKTPHLCFMTWHYEISQTANFSTRTDNKVVFHHDTLLYCIVMYHSSSPQAPCLCLITCM